MLRSARPLLPALLLLAGVRAVAAPTAGKPPLEEAARVLGQDTIQLRFRSMPKDLHAFAQRVARFCPDVVEQGVGTVEALEKAMRQARGVFLWWD
jgi:hypothetical protein